jgi:hypothetical protein
MKTKSRLTQSLGFLACITMVNSAHGQITGPSTGSTPYILPTLPGYETTSVFTVDNTGANPDDSVGGYSMTGIPDGLGAFDNNDGTFTLLMNHELGTGTTGVTRAHGAAGSFVSKWVINKNTLAVQAGSDLMTGIYGWNTATQTSNTVATPFGFGRFCSGDLPAPSALFNATSGLGSSERIYMHGEEGAATGYQQGTVVTGPDAGKSYTLGKFNLTTNGNTNSLTGVGAWENTLLSPFAQDKTIAIGLNDGGTGIMNNALSVYVGTKQSTGTEVDKAGLTNGTLKHVVIAGNPLEIPAANATSRVTNIINGTRFSLSATTSTTFSRPEDGAWDTSNPRYFYFVTTDRLDLASDGLGAQIGQTRLWRLTFDDITNPDAGGSIDILIDGRTVAGEKVNMFDNMCINPKTGHIILQEDVGGAAHNGKVWDFDPATNVLKKILKHDPARFGDRVGGVTTSATLPFTNDEEGSGIVDITSIMTGSTKFKGNPNEAWYISSDQSHYLTSVANPLTTAQVEGGQMLVIQDIAPTNNVAVTRGGIVRDRSTGKFVQKVTITNNNPGALAGPFYLAVDGLSANATLFNATGTTATYPPLGSSYITIPGGTLAAGSSASVNLQFTNSNNGAITFTSRVLNSIVAP